MSKNPINTTYFAEHDLAEGFEILDQHKECRLSRGRAVYRPSGWNLFSAMRGTKISCCFCGVEADRWIVEKGRRDKIGGATMNLYAGLVLMTRDHIIPKSLGGVDHNDNLRPCCATCNGQRSNQLDDFELNFAQSNPHLIDRNRVRDGLEYMQRQKAELVKQLADIRCAEAQLICNIDRLERPFKLLGYI